MTRIDISHTNFSAKVEPFMQKIVRKLFLEIESVKTYVRVLVKCPNSRHTSEILFFTSTRSYAALRAADLDWIVGPGYSLGRYILEKFLLYFLPNIMFYPIITTLDAGRGGGQE